MIYLNNAATTYPKPQEVSEAMLAVLRMPPESAFRSTSYRGENDVLSACRKNLGKLLGISDYERIFFTSGATDSINRVLGGLDLLDLPIVVTCTEHNSVLRPLFNNPMLSKNIHIVDCDINGVVPPENIERVIEKCEMYKRPTGIQYSGLLVLNHCSNVTGAVQEAERLGEICRKHGFLFFLDVAQSAGCIPINADEWGVDIMAFTGHKGLFGPQGTGGYYVRRRLFFRPVMFGGTGVDSNRLVYTATDFEYEVGTQNIVGIAGLNAGICYVLGRGVAAIEKEEQEKIACLHEELSKMPNVTIYGNVKNNIGPVLSFNIKDIPPQDVGFILQNVYDITVRTGIHCSPLIHRAIHSMGTVRVSISDFTSWEDVSALLQATMQMKNEK
ncbi:MAG: aminotransferase class V-fold PLP-dependent enzyme [Prevotella sp.]|nr:aminotransferase class V-fold PLP-dependent enzyme [Prevotella sp.]